MNTKLTIRLIGYSLIAIWSVWLIGRPEDVGPDTAEGTTVTINADAMIDSAEPPPVEEAERARAVRLYINHMLSSDQQIDRLMSYARQTPDDPAWSTPVRSVITGVIRVTEREAFESGEVYVECGGLLCFVHGDFNTGTTLTQLPLELWAASSRGTLSFATTRSQQSDKYGWVFFVASSDFVLPPGL